MPKDCELSGLYVDRSDLDGCGMLIRLEDGRLLLPVYSEPPAFTPRDSLRIRLSFTPRAEAASICMAEDLIGEVTCLQVDE